MTRPADWNIPLVSKPFKGDFRISSEFGVFEKIREGRQHTGIDFALPEGTPLFACMDGELLARGKEDGNGAGNRIHIFCGVRNLRASYFHMKEFSDEKTQKSVKQGELIGWSGNTGHSSGAHLHFEIRRIGDAAPLHPYFEPEYNMQTVKEKAPYELPKPV